MIEITGLTKRYGSHTVLDNIDFTVEAGTIAAIVGASGAGKSTLQPAQAAHGGAERRAAAAVPRASGPRDPPAAPRAFAGQLVVGTTYLRDPQIVKLIKVFLDPRVQAYLRTTTNPALTDQLTPASAG